jgi:hypothetical protein
MLADSYQKIWHQVCIFVNGKLNRFPQVQNGVFKIIQFSEVCVACLLIPTQVAMVQLLFHQENLSVLKYHLITLDFTVGLV